MNASPPAEPELLRRGLDEVRRRLPAGWRVSGPRATSASAPGLGARPDAIVRLTAPDGGKADLVVEVKGDGSPRTTAGAIRWLREWSRKADPLLVVPFLPRRSREMVEAAGVNYADLTGNLRVALRRPALFLRDRGAEVNPFPGKGPKRSLGGGAAGRVVLWLCQLAPPFGPRLLGEVAGGAGVSLSYASRIVDLLGREDLVRRKPRGPVVAVDRPGLVRRWAEDYSLLRSNRGRLYLDPRGAGNALEGMKSKPFQRMRFAVSGSFAARRYAPIAAPSKLVCFVEDPDAAAGALDLQAATGTGNVFLLAPYDPVVFEEARDLEPGTADAPIRFAPPAQVAVDCLTGPDRMPEEGEGLLEWLRRN